jgi:hypothetical protein
LETDDGHDKSGVKILGLLEVDDGYDKSGVKILGVNLGIQIEFDVLAKARAEVAAGK